MRMGTSRRNPSTKTPTHIFTRSFLRHGANPLHLVPRRKQRQGRHTPGSGPLEREHFTILVKSKGTVTRPTAQQRLLGGGPSWAPPHEEVPIHLHIVLDIGAHAGPRGAVEDGHPRP
mmetsp:Transcript_45042/g.143443  ORF Transcript_45042/g.143443 Transcript_45042/m.143443 type:complete len:117 (+) Transcript_45042:945-1295(+)